MFSGSIEPIDIDVAAIIKEDLSPEARSQALADFARAALSDAEVIDAAATGSKPTHTTVVDGSEGASEDRVRPDGTILYRFNILPDIFGWILEQLEANSPVGSGRDPHIGLYKASHALFADGVEIDPSQPIPPAQEYVFVNVTEYARKIEEGESSQASAGVYEAVATLANLKFGDMAAIKFSYRAPFDGTIIAYTPLGRSREKDHGNITAKRGRFAAARVERFVRMKADIERSLRAPAITITLR